MTKLKCVRFIDTLGFIWQYIAFHLWQYVGSIVIDSLLSTHDKFCRLFKTKSLSVTSVVPEFFSASGNIFMPLLSAKD